MYLNQFPQMDFRKKRIFERVNHSSWCSGPRGAEQEGSQGAMVGGGRTVHPESSCISPTDVWVRLWSPSGIRWHSQIKSFAEGDTARWRQRRDMNRQGGDQRQSGFRARPALPPFDSENTLPRFPAGQAIGDTSFHFIFWPSPLHHVQCLAKIYLLCKEIAAKRAQFGQCQQVA